MVWLMGEKQSNARGTPVGKGAARTLQKPHYPESFLLLLRSMQQFASPLSSSRILPSAGVIRNNWNPCQALLYSVESNPFVGFTATISPVGAQVLFSIIRMLWGKPPTRTPSGSFASSERMLDKWFYFRFAGFLPPTFQRASITH